MILQLQLAWPGQPATALYYGCFTLEKFPAVYQVQKFKLVIMEDIISHLWFTLMCMVNDDRIVGYCLACFGTVEIFFQ